MTWLRLGKTELKDAVDLLEIYSKPGFVPDHKLILATRAVVEHFNSQTIGVCQHTNFDKSIVYFVLLNGCRVGGELATLKEAKKRARELFDVVGLATWSEPSETMD